MFSVTNPSEPTSQRKSDSRISRRLIGTMLGALGACSGFTHAAPINITYTLSTTSKVSLNIYNSSGQIVRELLHTAPRTAGSKTEQWDGRDDAGVALPAASYTWKVLSTPGFGATYITNPGSNYTVDQTAKFWAQSVGCHGGPQTVAVDSTGFYVSGFTENVETALVKQSLTGSSRLWSQKNLVAWDTAGSIVPVGTSLWGRYANGTIYQYSTTTGEVISNFSGVSGSEAPTDMAANASGVILCYPTAGLVRWLNSTGTETRSVSVPGASTVDVAADGTVYVISGTDLRKITPTGTTSTVLVSGLVAPRRAAVNPTNGAIYVVQGGASQQVKRFSSAGALLNTYGVAGGRVDGVYSTQKTSFRGATDIAVESNGNFWVAEAEEAPRRVARFNSSGTWLSDYYGGQQWAPFIMPEPDNLRYVWVGSSWGSVMRCDVNYSSKTWSVHSTYHLDGLADGLIPNHDNGEVWMSRMHGGQLYLCHEGTPTVIKVDRTNWKLLPVTATEGYMGLHYSTLPGWLQTLYNADPTNRQSLVWRDENGDGRPLNTDGTPQMSELHFSAATAPYVNWQGLDYDFNYMMHGGPNAKIMRWAATSWNSVGAPVYSDFPSGVELASAPPRQTGNEDGRWTSHITADASGNIWGAFNPNVTGWGTSSDAFIAKWNSSGTLQWQSGHYNNKVGSLGTLRHIYGLINNGTGSDCLVVGRFSYEWEAEGVTPVYVYDQDGLYAGQVIGQPLNTAVSNVHYGLGAEALAGSINKDSSGNVYLFGQWINEGRIYKITGWTGWQRANGSVGIPTGYTAPAFIEEPTGPSGTGVGLFGQYYDSVDLTGPVAYQQTDPILNISATTIGAHSVRWTGTLTPRRTGWHKFQQPQGWRNGNCIWVNNINVAEMTFNSEGWPADQHLGPGRTIWLTAGTAYPIRVDYRRDYVWGGAADGINLQWSEPETNDTYNTIPQSQYSPAPTPTPTPMS